MTDPFTPLPVPTYEADPTERTWRPKDGPREIHGVCVDRKIVTTRAGSDVELVQIRDDAGTTWNIWCSNVQLKRAPSHYDWKVGDHIGVRFLGEKPSPKDPTRRVMDFDGYNLGPVPSTGKAQPAPTSTPTRTAAPPVDDDLPF